MKHLAVRKNGYVLKVQKNDSREDIKAIDKEIFPKKFLPRCALTERR
jgi:hypothetical protein